MIFERKKDTYKNISEWIKQKYGIVVKTCYIAHVKEMCGIDTRKVWNRCGDRVYTCPTEYVSMIKNAFRHFDLIK